MGELILKMEGISKSFPGVQALKDVSLNVYEGEAMALLGENGAGKSTLMKVLTGIYKRDTGTVTFDGRQVEYANARAAAEDGISIIHQELNLIPHMKIYENVFLGREIKGAGGRLDKQAMINETKRLLDQINVDLDPNREVYGLSIAMQQMVEIAKALSLEAKIIVMDEPTGALPDEEVESLFAIVRELKQKKKGIIYITHRLKEVFEICERATVFRDGERIDEVMVSDLTNDSLVNMMVGRELTDQFPYVEGDPNGDVLLEVKGLTNKFVKNASFRLRAGQILGVAGLAGAGRTELAKTIYGVYGHESGEIILKGQPVKISGPHDAIEKGIFYVSEDRKGDGVILDADVRTNMTLASLHKLISHTRIDRKKEKEICEKYREDLQVRTPSIAQLVRNLSGGNQQKVVLAKALMSEPDVLILDEPTRGIDVGAKKEIYQLANKLKQEGKAILLISSEMPEVLGVSDRILVMYEGEIKGELSREEATQEKIMSTMMS